MAGTLTVSARAVLPAWLGMLAGLSLGHVASIAAEPVWAQAVADVDCAQGGYRIDLFCRGAKEILDQPLESRAEYFGNNILRSPRGQALRLRIRGVKSRV